jgi:hypothetical protein
MFRDAGGTFRTHEAEQDIKQGRVISNDEMKSRITPMERWIIWT